jgi:MarR family transcriptional regulator for hemolysin
LIASGPLSQAELVGRLFITRATGVRLVDRMERDGWVVRHRDESDERVKRVVPTHRAGEVWERISGAGRTVVDQAYRGIGPEEVETAKRIMEKVRGNLNSLTGHRSVTLTGHQEKPVSRVS